MADKTLLYAGDVQTGADLAVHATSPVEGQPYDNVHIEWEMNDLVDRIREMKDPAQLKSVTTIVLDKAALASNLRPGIDAIRASYSQYNLEPPPILLMVSESELTAKHPNYVDGAVSTADGPHAILAASEKISAAKAQTALG